MLRKRIQGIISTSSQINFLIVVIQWLLLGTVMGVLTGSGSALLIISLDWATAAREGQPWLLYCLPLAGAAVSFLYSRYGGNAGKGNNLIIEQVQDGGDAVPLRMAPLVFVGTMLTHLFGGSAGREGTAVQMGGSLADSLARLVRLNPIERRLLLMCGMSGGFGSVFGTPLAGAVFGLEVIAIGMIRYDALLPCLTAALIGDWTTRAWGIHHSVYSIGPIPPLSIAILLKIIVVAIVFGLTSRVFSGLIHAIKRVYAYWFPSLVLRSFVGGIIVIAVVLLLGTQDYSGLSLPLLEKSFSGSIASLAFVWKMLLTALTLGAGFQGGEVTPLFVVGAALGNALAALLHVSLPFFAALGLVGVLCGAVNTPIACFILGIELFGSEAAVHCLSFARLVILLRGIRGSILHSVLQSVNIVY